MGILTITIGTVTEEAGAMPTGSRWQCGKGLLLVVPVMPRMCCIKLIAWTSRHSIGSTQRLYIARAVSQMLYLVRGVSPTEVVFQMSIPLQSKRSLTYLRGTINIFIGVLLRIRTV